MSDLFGIDYHLHIINNFQEDDFKTKDVFLSQRRINQYNKSLVHLLCRYGGCTEAMIVDVGLNRVRMMYKKSVRNIEAIKEVARQVIIIHKKEKVELERI